MKDLNLFKQQTQSKEGAFIIKSSKFHLTIIFPKIFKMVFVYLFKKYIFECEKMFLRLNSSIHECRHVLIVNYSLLLSFPKDIIHVFFQFFYKYSDKFCVLHYIKLNYFFTFSDVHIDNLHHENENIIK